MHVGRDNVCWQMEDACVREAVPNGFHSLPYYKLLGVPGTTVYNPVCWDMAQDMNNCMYTTTAGYSKYHVGIQCRNHTQSAAHTPLPFFASKSAVTVR